MESGKSVCGPERGCHETAVIRAGKSLLAHEKETLEYKRQLAELGDKVEYQKRLNELAQQAVRFEEQQSAKQAAISAKARGLTDRQAQRESEAQRLRDVYGDNPRRWPGSPGH